MPNLFPTETTINAPEINRFSEGEALFGRSWRFDFGAGDFILTPSGGVATAEGIEAYMEWCQKTLLTQRYRYLIYSRNYGSEYEELAGRGYSRAIIESEVERMTGEALLVDPRTAEVNNFSFSWREDALYFTCDITTVRGEKTTIGSEVKLS
ncbi:phage-like element PBSX protein xkdS [Desulfocucumis palustris]|uniref:Phage-like element PBSX protein xkdS n=1 Tax=Desulfocucumis palustris TaxID=1898651 RepID=A0A2L2XGW8_9FIRM|nr:DUF2634 domain-containing protein [Desulfocucumis palustris]GBF35488.1 phage-like element PBSX protein xkdS [Desulfocucumis palustris]